jgi:hypothetical protein
MKAIALVLAALSLSAGTAAVAEPVESVDSIVSTAKWCSATLEPNCPRGQYAYCECDKYTGGGCAWVCR